MHLGNAPPGSITETLEELARRKDYGKIFAKIPVPAWPTFESVGYAKEAEVPGFFNGRTDRCFIAQYLTPERRIITPTVDHLLGIEFKGAAFGAHRQRPGRCGCVVSACRPSDDDALSRIYRQVFKTYPFPIHQPVYLKRMMKEGVRYFTVRSEGRMAAAAAAEIGRRGQYAEMTDFATLPQYRGKGLAGILLCHMEKSVRSLDIRTAFTIARADSPGMIAVFAKTVIATPGCCTTTSRLPVIRRA